MSCIVLRYWLSTLTRHKPFGSSVPRPENARQNMFSMNKWLKTPDVDGRYHPIVRDFQAAIPEVLDALPRKYFQQPVSWMTRSFHQFDDVSLIAAQGIFRAIGYYSLASRQLPLLRAGWPAGRPSRNPASLLVSPPGHWLCFRPAGPAISDLSPCDSYACVNSNLASFGAFLTPSTPSP